MPISFRTTKEEKALIDSIADRITAMDDTARQGKLDWMMDITAVHANGNPLRLADLLAADDGNFAHDLYGIARHIDRTTGHLTNLFSPRYSLRDAA